MNTIVHAFAIDDNRIYYKCANQSKCINRFKLHYAGNNGGWLKGEEVGHSSDCEKLGEIILEIDDATIRGTPCCETAQIRTHEDR